jgi:hypothetical protein
MGSLSSSKKSGSGLSSSRKSSSSPSSKKKPWRDLTDSQAIRRIMKGIPK